MDCTKRKASLENIQTLASRPYVEGISSTKAIRLNRSVQEHASKESVYRHIQLLGRREQ